VSRAAVGVGAGETALGILGWGLVIDQFDPTAQDLGEVRRGEVPGEFDEPVDRLRELGLAVLLGPPEEPGFGHREVPAVQAGGDGGVLGMEAGDPQQPGGLGLGEGGVVLQPGHRGDRPVLGPRR